MPSFLDLAHNRRTIDQLIDTMRRRQGVIPFVGAGLSFDFGFPLWEPFLLQVAGEAACSTEVDAILHLPDTDRYEAQRKRSRIALDAISSDRASRPLSDGTSRLKRRRRQWFERCRRSPRVR